jgi:hypothetical protein
VSVIRLRRGVTLLLGRIEQGFEKRQAILRRSSHADIVLAGLFRSSMATARSVVHLTRSGFGADALGMSRSIAEKWITIRFITNKDTDARALKFRAFNARQHERIIELLDAYNANLGHEKYKGNVRIKRMAAAYSKWDRWGENSRTMALEAEEFDPELDQRLASKWVYDVPFFVASSFLHPTSWGIRHQLLRPGDSFSFRDGEDERRLAHQAMMTTAHCMAHQARRMSLYWGLGLEEDFTDYWDRYIQPHIPQTRATAAVK